MSDELRELMYEVGRDEIDELVQEIVKIEKSFKNRKSNTSSRREQIKGEIDNLINKRNKEEGR